MKRNAKFVRASSPGVSGVQRLTRRHFLAMAGPAVSLPWLVPSTVFAANGKPGANERLTVAHIGVGGMGSSHLRHSKFFREEGRVNLAAVCDVDEKQLANGLKEAGPGVTPYRDYRYILERRDIDAVIIATPDHWHAVQCVQACETGKDVYVEKPSSVTIAEGQAMVRAARRSNRVVQVGSQARSAQPAHDACQFIRNGMLGRVHTVKCWHSLNPVGGTEPDSEPPAHLDWDLWLGPLSWRPYNPGYCPGTFRWLLESGGGVIRDRGAHCFSVIRWCLDADNQAPETVEAIGTLPPKGLWDCPPEMKVVYTFKNPDWQLIWEQPGEKVGRADFGVVFHGDKDKLVMNRDGTQIDLERKAHNFQVPPGGVSVYRVSKHADYNLNHKEDWFAALKTRHRPCMDIELGHRAATLCILGNLSYILGRKLRWDAANERIIDDPCANRLLSRPQRYPYSL